MPAAGLERPDPRPWRVPLALVAGLLMLLPTTPLRAQNTTNCRRELGNRDPLSGAEAWTVATCTTTNRISGQVVRVQTCTTNHRYGTTECVDQAKP